jgi:AAA domain
VTEAWLERASDLLAEPDPGPTPYLVEDLIVDGAIAAILAAWKATKTWLILELSIAITTGRPALGRLPVPKSGPVILVLEESGRAALYRRLDALLRGHAIRREDLADLHVAANRRVRLNDRDWQRKLSAAAKRIGPRAIFLDPLVRLKGAQVDENLQREMGPVLDYMRDLRDAVRSAVVFSAHTGHEHRGRMRGTSDLEGYWESKVTITPAGENRYTLDSEHREAEGVENLLSYRRDWDESTRSIRLQPLDDEAEREMEREVVGYVRDNPNHTTEEIAAGVHRNRAKTSARLKWIQDQPTNLGTLRLGEQRRRDKAGRWQATEVWIVEPGAADRLPRKLPRTGDGRAVRALKRRVSRWASRVSGRRETPRHR